ncbi:Cytochrome b-c1 complex subunit 7, mitochondrial [Clarireedia jacksonii]
MSAPSFATFAKKTPWLHKILKPMASWYVDAAGYRKLGLRADDLIPEESEIVLLAISRLEKKEAYDRVFRMRRAMQDYPYLSPIIAEIQAEAKERADLESLTILKK